jgi:hypothetical protein
LQGTVNSPKGKNLLEEKISELVMNNFGKNKDLIDRLFKKSSGHSVSKIYPENIKKFVLTLHFFSPKGYNCVCSELEDSVPHENSTLTLMLNLDSHQKV